jgi:DNA-binding SARP family transcriptional activator
VDAFEHAASELVETPLGDLRRSTVESFEHVAAICCCDLLEGVDLPWLVIERERLSQLGAAGNLRALDWYAQAEEPELAIAAGQRILRRDPLREDVHRKLIRIFCSCNQRANAARQFEECRSLLREELGVLPLPETVAAAAGISRTTNVSASPPLMEVETALELIESAAHSLGLVVEELDTLVRSIRKLTPSR